MTGLGTLTALDYIPAEVFHINIQLSSTLSRNLIEAFLLLDSNAIDFLSPFDIGQVVLSQGDGLTSEEFLECSRLGYPFLLKHCTEERTEGNPLLLSVKHSLLAVLPGWSRGWLGRLGPLSQRRPAR